VLALAVFAQTKYSSIGGIETPYRDKYKFTAKLDEKTNILSFETDAPVTVVTLETYTSEELIARKGKEYTNTYTKTGNKYSYDLKKPLLKDKHAYWLKVSIGNNGVPLAEYLFKKTAATAATEPAEEVATASDEEIKNADGATVITTNIKCAAGKTKVVNALKEMEGVFDVKVDIVTGKLTIKYSSDGTPYTTLLSTINENGFDANGQKSANPSANPCKTKSSN
jgi:copper chaperone CopZ